jgi:flagellar hook-basal body complex protein FliE
MSDIKIDDIRRQLEDISIKSNLTTSKEEPGEKFANFLKNAINEVNQDQLQADKSVQDYVSGKETSLHHTLLSLEKADLSFKMMMQVRSKLMEAYQQIMRTNI